MRNLKTKKLISIYITLMFLISIFALRLIYESSNVDAYIWLKINSLTGLTMLTWSIVSWRNLTKNTISLYIVYILTLYLFTYGQSLLIVFNLVYEEMNLINRLSVTELVNAQFFTLFSLTSFHLGALFMVKRTHHNDGELSNKSDTKDSVYMNRAIKYVGFILLVFSLPGFMFETINTLKTVIQGGYGALYNYHTDVVVIEGLFVRIFSATSDYFIPALICLLIGYRSNKKVTNFIIIMMIVNVLNALYVGGRGKAVILLTSLVLIRYYCKGNDKNVNILKIGSISYLLVSFLTIVARLRNVSNKSIFDYFILFIDSFSTENLFIITISEMGGTMFPLGAVMRIIPSSYSYFYGKSYIYAITAIIPNLGFWELHPAKIYSGGAQWLMDTLNLWSGPAFTLIADAYRNFGWYGFIVLIGFGMFFGKIYLSIDKYSIYNNPRLLCIVMIFFVSTLTSVRGDNLSIVRPLFYIVLPISFLIRIIYNSILEKSV